MKLIRPNTITEGVQAFTRASTATYVDRDGVLQTAAVNEPRFQGGALLVEGAGTNLLPASSGFQNTGFWTNDGSVSFVTGQPSPDGASNSVKINEAPSTGAHTVYRLGVIGAGFSCASIFVKAVERSWVRLTIAGVGAFFDLSAGVVGAVDSGVATSIAALSGGWWRIGVSRVVSSSSSVGLRLALANNSDTYTGVVGNGVLAFGAQAEALAAPTSYIPTTTTTATRAADVPAASGLLATTATEAHPTYNPATAYAVAARVVSGVSIYESLTAANTGNPPATSPTHWVRRGPSNAWALLDAEVSTQTAAAGVLSLALAPGIFDTLAVIGVDAEAVTLTVQDGAGGPIVYQQTHSVTGADVFDWYEYFFSDPTVRRTLAVFGGVPPYASAVATLTVAGGGAVKAGGVALGRVQTIGDTQYGAQAGITDFSRKDTDEFGATTFVKRAMSKKLTATVQVGSLDVNRVHRLLSDLRATPVLWIGTDAPEFSEPLVVYGFYRDFYLSIAYPTVGLYQLEIEGLS